VGKTSVRGLTDILDMTVRFTGSKGGTNNANLLVGPEIEACLYGMKMGDEV
jgi:hypothetical protein